MSEEHNPYDTLGINEEISKDEKLLKKVYRKLITMIHPDFFKDEKEKNYSDDKTTEVNLAYEKLSKDISDVNEKSSSNKSLVEFIIQDKDNNKLADVNIKVTNDKSRDIIEGITKTSNIGGIFLNLPNGKHNIQFTKKGYELKESKRKINKNVSKIEMKLRESNENEEGVLIDPGEGKSGSNENKEEDSKNIDQRIIDKVNKIAKKKKAEFPEKYIEDIAYAYIKRELTDKELETLINKFKKAYEISKVESGESIGAVAAQSIGESGTQMTLNTFHDAGVESVTVTYGLERLIEVIEALSKPSKLTQMITIYLKDKQSDEDFVKKIASQIAEITINDILQDSIEVDYAKMEVKAEIDIDKVKEKQIDLKDVFKNIDKKFNKGKKYIISTDENIVTLKPKINEIQIRDIRLLADKIRDFQIAGVKNVTEVMIRKDDDEWVIHADVTKSPDVKAISVIFKNILKMGDIDIHKTTTNHIPVIYEVLGIEAARNAIINEFNEIFIEQGLSVDIRHLMLVADMMTADGTLQPIGRHGISGSKSSVLARASFEETGKHLLNASMRGEVDEINGVIENIIIGQPIPMGTGSVNIIMKNK
jgi:DNA-directed RNA polymerase subunit A"